MRSIPYILATLITAAVIASASNVVQTERLEVRVDNVQKDSEKSDGYIIKRLDRIEGKLDLIIEHNRR